ncbi:MAG: DNA-binding protein [Thermoprotei archaeon]|nr:MAG: DNA-binding protein [Thermoprotei archaeon]RLF13525.1 MAG: DNA-binding protein [Thermoprotei archaeon]
MSDEYVVDEELEEIQRRKLLQYQQMAAEAQRRAELQRQMELAKQSVLRQILTPEARSRLTNIKMVRPELAEQLEAQLIQLAQAGRLKVPVTDEDLKEVLRNIQLRARREWRIQRV